MPVPDVLCFFVLVVVLVVAEFIVQLCIQPVLHEFCDAFREKCLDIRHAGDVAFLQELPDFCSPGLLFGISFLSAVHCKTSNVVLLFCTTSEVYIFWEGLWNSANVYT